MDHVLRSVGKRLYFSFSWIFLQEEGLRFRLLILAGQRRGGVPLRLRSSLSQLPPRRRSVMLTGRKTATRSFYADAQFVSGIRSLVTVAAASRHMTSTTTGFGSIAAAAPIAGRPLLSFRCSLFLIRITVWWRGARHCSDALRSNVRGKKLCRSSRTPIVRPIPPQFNAGRAGWTVPNYWCPSSARRSPA